MTRVPEPHDACATHSLKCFGTTWLMQSRIDPLVPEQPGRDIGHRICH